MSSKSPLRVLRDLGEGFALWRIWTFMAWNDIVTRYRRSIIGPFWVAGAMAATSIAMALVFGAIFGQPLVEILPYIMCGLVAWQLAALAFIEGPETFMGQAGTMHNHAFPTSFYVYRFALRALVVTGHNLVVLAITLIAVRTEAFPTWQVIPGFILLILFATFSSAIAGVFSARYRDLRFMLPAVAQLLFFLTPIFWRVESVPVERAVIYQYNPLYYMLVVVRDPILGAAVPAPVWIGAIGVVAATFVLYVLTMALFRRRLPFWI